MPMFDPGLFDTPPMTVVSFQDAKTHLRVTDDLHDAEIQSKLNQATARIQIYLSSTGCWDASWVSDTTTPLTVQAAILKVLGGFYEHRGDDSSKSDDHDLALWDEITRLLAQYRKPALA